MQVGVALEDRLRPAVQFKSWNLEWLRTAQLGKQRPVRRRQRRARSDEVIDRVQTRRDEERRKPGPRTRQRRFTPDQTCPDDDEVGVSRYCGCS